MILAYVGLGANLGEPRRQIEKALSDLRGIPRTRLLQSSSLYRSAPLGYVHQPEFINAVAQVRTDLTAPQLLSELQAIEARHGRSRSFPDAPRTLDLDLLLYGDAIVAEKDLLIPHPRMHERAFVLQPLLEIAPETAIPGRGPASNLLEACSGQSVERLS